MNDNWWSEGEWLLRSVNRKRSDHRALHLSLQETNWGPVPFKVYNTSLQNKDLLSSLDEVFKTSNDKMNPNIQLMLKRARNMIKEWSKQDKNNIDVRIKEVKSSINEIDCNLGNAEDLPKLNSVLEELYDQKVSMMKPKARVTWALKEDHNMKFYHQ